MDIVRTEAGAPPVRPTPGMGDHPSAMALFAAIVTALYRREKTGKGAHVGSSLLANGLWANGYLAQAALCGAKFIDRPPREQALNALTTYYRCRDGRWLILTILNEQRQWPAFAKALGREDLVSDSRFATKQDRLARSRELVATLDAIFLTRDREEWRKALAANGIVFDVVATPDDIPADEQLSANHIVIPFEDGTLRTVSSPFFIEGSERVQPRQPPALGQHSDQILQEAGYDGAEIRSLQEQGAVR
jgi:formyl-CoA transferase